MRQARARQTRSSLIDAAAAQFAQCGYGGATLARISHAAGVTSGALTFHFPSKEELARAVIEAGADTARSALQEVEPVTTPGPAGAERLTRVLAALLDQNVRVHAAVRLSCEWPGGRAVWEEAWHHVLLNALELAREGGADEAQLADMELLVTYLLAGAEAQLRSGRPAQDVQQDLSRLWQRFALGLGTPTSGGPVLGQGEPVPCQVG